VVDEADVCVELSSGTSSRAMKRAILGKERGEVRGMWKSMPPAYHAFRGARQGGPNSRAGTTHLYGFV